MSEETIQKPYIVCVLNDIINKAENDDDKVEGRKKRNKHEILHL